MYTMLYHFTIDVISNEVEMLMLYDVETTNLSW